MVDVVFGFDELDRVSILKQSKKAYDISYGVEFKETDVQSRSCPEVTYNSLFLRGDVEKYDNNKILDEWSSIERIKVFIEGVIALHISGYKVSFRFESGHTLDIKYLEVNKLLEMTYNSNISLHDIVLQFDKRTTVCRL